ncbi:hypothetical protein Stsp01_24700 [Streptomyces sp. NBRC 13847]|nr:hypothetical protein Stsp01_24700 [Streptomyces sp. NBRC 13847]
MSFGAAGPAFGLPCGTVARQHGLAYVQQPAGVHGRSGLVLVPSHLPKSHSSGNGYNSRQDPVNLLWTMQSMWLLADLQWVERMRHLGEEGGSVPSASRQLENVLQ